MENHTYIGIDPGRTGAIAVLNASPGGELFVLDMPYLGDEPDVRTIHGLISCYCDAFVAIERQQAMPQQGVTSTFTTGKGFGMLLAAIYIANAKVVVPRPTEWKKDMGIPPKSDKDYSRMLAKRLFPTAELQRAKDHGRAEALLLAEWCRRQV